MKTINLFIFLLIFSAGLKVQAQQDPMFTHYMDNTLIVNPAYAGSRDALSFTALHRSQWVNFDGAPTTQTFNMHGPTKSGKVGLGLSVLNDKIGPTQNTSAYVDFAYIIKTSEKGRLALGLNAGINYMRTDLTTLKLDNQNDASFQYNLSSRLLPNFGAGIYYYLPRFYIGVSVPKLLENNFYTNSISGGLSLKNDQRHYTLIAGTVVSLSKNVELKPTILVKATMGAPIQGDVTATFIFHKKFLLGAMYRSLDAAGALVGFNITDQFHIGYSYDWSFANQTVKYNAGSHEILLRYDLIFNKTKVRSPRYF